MAETPKYFDIEDTETGKKYRIETTDPAATYDEAVQYFSSLSEDQWSQYEYRPKAAAQPKTAPTRTASVAMENVPEPEFTGAIERNVGTGVQSVLTRETANIQELDDALASAWRQGERNPAKLAALQESILAKYVDQYPELANKQSNINARSVAQAMRFEADQKARGNNLNGYVFAPSQVTTGLKDPEAPDNVGEQFLQAGKRSLANMANSLTGTAALGADLVGADETADALLEEYITKNAQIAFEYGTAIQTGEIDNLGDAGMFAADTFGELAPQITSSLGLGWAGKAAAEYGVKKGVQEYVEDQVQNGVAREVAEQQAAALITKRGLQGAATATTTSSVAQETGTTFADTFQQTGEKAPMSSLVAGVVSGSLDSILPMTVLKKFGGDALANQFKREFIRRAGKEGAKGFLIESGTEAMQEFITSLPKSVVTGESPFTEENFNQMFEAFIRGGLGGTGTNVAVEGVNSVRMATRDAPAQEPTGEPIVVPTGKRNTKAYRQQVAEAQDRVIEQVNSLTKGWTNTPDIEVYDNFTKLEGIDNGAIGVYTEKTLEDGTKVPVIKINTEAVLDRAKKRDVSPESVIEAVTFHEALGHHGLTSLFREDLDAFLDDIYTNGSEEFRNTVDSWLRKNPGSYSKYSADSRRILATEEVMAGWSEKGPLPRTLYDKIANLIKDFGRQMGMNLKYTTREVRAFLAVANERTMTGVKRDATPSVARNMDDERTPDTYSAGFKRPKTDERSRTEARKQFWKNKDNPDWNPNDPNGLPTEPKYMASDGSITPDDLTADDLIEAKNAKEVLDLINYEPTVIPPDELEAAVVARGMNPSDVTRLAGMAPGTLMKRLFQYDLAATKIGERVAIIKSDIETKGLTPERQLAFMKATVAFDDITSKLFDLQAELGRSLAANRRVNYSRKRLRTLKEYLAEYDLDMATDPETFMRFMSEVEARMAPKEGKAQFGTGVAQYINIPRAIMSSADLSAPLRQGIVFVSYPEYWKSFVKMFSMLGPSGERNYKFLMEKIATHPDYELMQKARVAFSSLDGELTQREEDFQTELARKIPVFGKVVKASEQAYAGFLNKLRADMFNRFVADYRKANIEPDEETLKGIGRFINAGTGRAELPEFLRPSSTVINATFFSGRLMYSRVQMLNPVFYAQLPKGLRVQAARSMLGFAGIAGLVAMSLNALWPEEIEVEVDPRSSDFMKIKVGNTRFDIGGGFNQYIVLGARTGSWLYNNTLGFVDRQLGTELSEYEIANKITAGGDERKFGNDEYGQETFGGAIGQFFRTKLSPQASYVVDAMVGEDVIGREFTLEGSLASRLVPMTVGSVYESYKQDSPVPLPVIFTASLFGVGTNTYTAPGMDPKKELEPPVAFDMKDLANRENDMIRVEAGTVTLKKAARDKWEATLNNYYPLFVEEVAAEMGLKFEEMDDTMKKATVKEATKRTRESAKKDMMYELGLK